MGNAASSASVRAARETTVVAGVAVGIATLSATWLTHPSVAIVNHYQGLTLAAAAVGAAAAIVADLAARLADVPRVSWSGAALAVYSVVVIPSTVLGPDGPGPDDSLTAMSVVAYLTVVILFLMATLGSQWGGIWGGWSIAAAGTLAAVLAGHLVSFAPDGAVRAVLDGALPVIALGGWCWLAAVHIQHGLRFGGPVGWRVGIGMAVLGGAQLYRMIAATPLGGPNIGFAALRLLGLLVILVAMTAYWLHTLGRVRDDQQRQAAQLDEAMQRLREVATSGARRDHELRNGITALVGITELLSSTDEDNRVLRAGVLAEIRRLSRMVEDAPRGRGGQADVAAVLRQTAAVHRAGGQQVELAVPDGLRAEMPDAVLRQILTNLLANARRHAPGALVELRASRTRALVVVEVRDHGPGVPPGREEAVFHEGERDASRGGAGLGLGISRELAVAHHGSLTIRPFDPQRPGCVVVLTLAAAGGFPLPRPRTAS